MRLTMTTASGLAKGRAPLAYRHLMLRLGAVHRALEAAAGRVSAEHVSPKFVAKEQADRLLDAGASACHAAAFGEGAEPDTGGPVRLTSEEKAMEAKLRDLAKGAGLNLPLDGLRDQLRLSSVEVDALVLCAASEVDSGYERIFGYLLDDFNRRLPCPELVGIVLAASPTELADRRKALGPWGRLRRYGLLVPVGEGPTGLRQELRLAPGLFEFLSSGEGDPADHFRDPEEVALPSPLPGLPPHVDAPSIAAIGEGLGDGRFSALGVWGPRHAGLDDVVMALANHAMRPLRRWIVPCSLAPAEAERSLALAVEAASVFEAILWVDTGPLQQSGQDALSEAAAARLAGSRVRLCLTGERPWRPPAILRGRSYRELWVTAPAHHHRVEMWRQALPALTEADAEDLAANYRLGPADVRAASTLAREGGGPGGLKARAEAASAAVARPRAERFSTLIIPRRTRADLILPDDLKGQVLEVAGFARAWSKVSEEWGFGRLMTGSGGIKALFTGDPGTGKTLAAEVIAGELGVPLLRIDIARVVSKWVGETEKFLDAAFTEAEDSHAAVFIDECDTLLARRGEVQRGSDRYANQETGYLLQRMEDHRGLIVLASNHQENIDPGFMRRFPVNLRFPRPGPAERKQIWDLALANLPVDPPVDTGLLARLDLTGAGIVESARTAALLAAHDGGPVTPSHIVKGVARQFRRESKILSPASLGPLARWLDEEGAAR